VIRSRVLVTGAGGAAGVAVIRHLATLGMFTVATDTDPFAAGLFLATEHAVVAPACEPDEFIADIVEATRRFDIDVVVCTVAEEMRALAGHELEIDAGVWVPARAATEACLDKLRFAVAMRDAHVPVPPTVSGIDPRSPASDLVPGPWIVKPRFGRGSRDVYAVDDAAELDWACRRVVDPVVQSRASGREFTIDLLTDRSGVLVGAVPRWRLETKAGISTKGRTFADAGLVSIAARALRGVGLCGAANLQGFVDDDGAALVIEINPRFSGGLPLSLAAGADLVCEYLRLAQGRPPSRERLQFRAGVTMTRHLQEVILQ
jgi:carbamoyl-phosphate synthase large subunit